MVPVESEAGSLALVVEVDLAIVEDLVNAEPGFDHAQPFLPSAGVASPILRIVLEILLLDIERQGTCR